jgi:hypothetical protein
LSYIEPEKIQSVLKRLNEVSRILNGLITALAA